MVHLTSRFSCIGDGSTIYTQLHMEKKETTQSLKCSWWKKSQTTTWDVKKTVNNRINYQPQLVSLPDFWIINSTSGYLNHNDPQCINIPKFEISLHQKILEQHPSCTKFTSWLTALEPQTTPNSTASNRFNATGNVEHLAGLFSKLGSFLKHVFICCFLGVW